MCCCFVLLCVALCCCFVLLSVAFCCNARCRHHKQKHPLSHPQPPYHPQGGLIGIYHEIIVLALFFTNNEITNITVFFRDLWAKGPFLYISNCSALEQELDVNNIFLELSVWRLVGSTVQVIVKSAVCAVSLINRHQPGACYRGSRNCCTHRLGED